MQNNIVHTEQLHGLKIEIEIDDCPMAPWEEGEEGIIVCGYHREFFLNDDIVCKDELLAYFENDTDNYNLSFFDDYFVIPLSAYIHSGVRLYLGTHKECQWDSGQIGAVLVAKTEAATYEHAVTIAEGTINHYNNYLSGNVYGYRIINSNGDELSAVWGFYGDYEHNALLAAQEEANAFTHNGQTDVTGQKLFDFLRA